MSKKGNGNGKNKEMTMDKMIPKRIRNIASHLETLKLRTNFRENDLFFERLWNEIKKNFDVLSALTDITYKMEFRLKIGEIPKGFVFEVVVLHYRYKTYETATYTRKTVYLPEKDIRTYRRDKDYIKRKLEERCLKNWIAYWDDKETNHITLTFSTEKISA